MTVDEVGIFVDIVAGTDGLIYTFLLWSIIIALAIWVLYDIPILISLMISPIVVIGIGILVAVSSILIFQSLPVIAGILSILFILFWIPIFG